jgi:predicted nucleic acid-binding Zn finger protein
MATSKSSAPARPSARFGRGILLGQERFEEIRRTSTPYVWEVPSCSSEETYTVNLKMGFCSCPDRVPADEECCKHVVAARYVKARTAICAGCGERVRHKELVEVGADNLTFFEGDLLCTECACAHGVL